MRKILAVIGIVTCLCTLGMQAASAANDDPGVNSPAIDMTGIAPEPVDLSKLHFIETVPSQKQP